jgi:hypothetical protein
MAGLRSAKIRHLRTIAEKLEWDKRITFHVARNTCSNLLYQLNVSIEIRSLIVGDTGLAPIP